VTTADRADARAAPAPVSASDPLYGEVLDFLYAEAALLDAGDLEAWLGLLAEDVTYRLPLRVNRRTRGEGDRSDATEIFSDDLASLRVRAARLRTAFAWAETPPSRTRHLVTNVRVWRAAAAHELDVVSYFLVYRNRSTAPSADLFSGERQDRLRRVDGGWKLAARLITLDQAVVGARNISVLL
jgi:3-phenylpropionate/cinnamic acid dioxygenase small subunit